MTVSTVVDHNDYVGNGVTTSFPYTFRIFEKSDLVVTVIDLNENLTELTLDTDYTVTNAGGYAGGNVVLSSALANGWKISIARELEATQETDLRNQGKFFAEVHEDAFDKLTMLIQQTYSAYRLALRKPASIANWYDALNNYIRNLRDPRDPQDASTKNYTDNLVGSKFNKTLRVPESFIPEIPSIAQRANKILGFNDLGNPTPVLPGSGSASDVMLQLAASDGSHKVTYTNPNGPGIPMPLDVRIGQTYFMSDYGVSPSSTAAQNTARINAVFAALGGQAFIAQFIFDCKGVVLINDSLLLKNNMDIWVHTGTEIRNVAGTNRPVFVSEYWFATIANPSNLSQKSDYLGIRGGGLVNYNQLSPAPGGLNVHAICIAGVKRLKLGGNLKVTGAFKYAYLCANIDYLDAQDLEFDNPSDGLHLQPPVFHAYVRNLRGHTGDDLFAMTGGDYAAYDIGTRGNFTFIDVEGLFNDNTLCAVKLAGNAGVEFKHVTVRGIHGSCQHATVRIWADGNLLQTTVRHASFSEISAIPGTGYGLCEVYDRGFGTVSVDNLSFKNPSTNLTTLGTPVVDVRGSVGVNIQNIDMDVPRNVKFGFVCGDGTGNDQSRVYNLSINSLNSSLVNDAFSSLCLVTRGTLDTVNIRGTVDHKSAATLVQQRGGNIGNVNIEDVVYSNGHLFRQFVGNANTSNPMLTLSNVKGTTSGQLATFYKGGKVLGANVNLRSTTGSLISTTTAGQVDIIGQIDYGSSLIPSAVTAGFYYRAYGLGITVDVANLQRTGNQFCNNSNASFAAGVGLLGFSSGTGWKNLVTGATG
ncbi:hypothetical protein AB2S17_01115 [Escherichia coli]|uniref:hypothetical protein n=1 Tax=Escherichia coli TaxID=562 RepID=UPI002E0E9E8C